MAKQTVDSSFAAIKKRQAAASHRLMGLNRFGKLEAIAYSSLEDLEVIKGVCKPAAKAYIELNT